MWQVTNNLSLSSSYISFRKSLLHWFFFLLFPYMSHFYPGLLISGGTFLAELCPDHAVWVDGSFETNECLGLERELCYSIPCGGFPRRYIGQTGRSLECCLAEFCSTRVCYSPPPLRNAEGYKVHCRIRPQCVCLSIYLSIYLYVIVIG